MVLALHVLWTPVHVYASYDQAAEHCQWGRYKEAAAVLETLVEQSAGGRELGKVHLMLGQCYAELGCHDEALFALYTAAYKYPDGAYADEALLALARAARETGNTPALLEACERLADRYPRSPHAAYARTCAGWVHGSRGDFRKAAVALADVAQKYSDSPYAQTAKQSIEAMGIAPPAVAPKSPPSVAVPQPASLPVDKNLLRVSAARFFEIRTPRGGAIEILVGDTPDLSKARLHLRRTPSGVVAMRYEGRWITVGAQDVYGDQITLIRNHPEGNQIAWTFMHDLPEGARTAFYKKRGSAWGKVVEILSVP